MRKLLPLALILLLLACNLPGLPLAANPQPPTVNAPAAPTSNAPQAPTANRQPSTTNAAPPSGPALIPGSTQKICQLLGDVDWQTGQPTAARTLTNFGLDAADLGYPVESPDRLYFLFGDSWPQPRLQPGAGQDPPNDSVGMTQRTTPPTASDGKCLELQVNHDAGKFTPALITGPVKVDQGSFNVPSGGVSLNDALYVFFWTNHCGGPNKLAPDQQHPLARPAVSNDKKCPENDAHNSLGRSVLAQSTDEGRTFSQVVSVPSGFVYDTAVNTRLQNDIPAAQRLGVFIFGVPRYRASIPYLAYAPAASFADPGTWQFFSGLDANGGPRWVDSAAWLGQPASPAQWTPPGQPELFAAGDADRCVGEFSVAWISALAHWLMLYGCAGQGMLARMAPAPWGPWSSPVVLLNNGPAVQCQLVMSASGCGSRRDYWPSKEQNGKFEPGAFYAPFVLSRYTTSGTAPAGTRQATIYWLVSTWNPYDVDLMQSTLQVH